MPWDEYSMQPRTRRTESGNSIGQPPDLSFQSRILCDGHITLTVIALIFFAKSIPVVLPTNFIRDELPHTQWQVQQAYGEPHAPIR